MDIVVRTPHGDADVTVGDHGAAACLARLVADVTGQAAPSVVVVDGRALDGSTTIDDAGLNRGSILESAADTFVDDTVVVELLQVTGHGTGRRLPLTPGRFRIGPGRRSHADELSSGIVESTRATITVEPDGTVQLGDPATPVPADLFPAGGRWFVAQRTEPSGPVDRSPAIPDADGTLPLVRTVGTTAPDLPMIAAMRRTATRRPGLWSCRSWDHDALDVPGGIDDLGDVVRIDLSGPATALCGDERFRYAAARAAVIEAVTLHGPADLSVVIATTPERRSLWEWAKWLPHVRRSPGDLQILGDRAARAAWSETAMQATVEPSSPSPERRSDVLTVIDEPTLWTEPESGLGAVIRLLSGPSIHIGRTHLHGLLLCGPDAAVPSYCTTIISQLDDRRARFSRPRSDDVEASVSLVEESVALDVARLLAPLRDPELEVTTPTNPAPTIGLDELLHVEDLDTIVDNWRSDHPLLPPIVIGRRDGVDVTLPVGAQHIWITGRDRGAAQDTTVAIVASMATALSPHVLHVLPLVDTGPSRLDTLRQLPHTVDGPTLGLDPDRLVARLQRVITEPSDRRRHVALVLAGAQVAPMSAALDRAGDAIQEGPGTLHLIVVDHGEPSATPAPGSASILVEIVGGVRRAVLLGNDDDGRPFEPWSPAEVSPAPDEVRVRPYVVGRPMTPIERRLGEQARRSEAAPTDDLERVLERCRRAAQRSLGEMVVPQLVPPPFPDRIDGTALFDDWPADAVPVGLVDRPADLERAPLWWQPGDGALVGIGSPRSGIAALADIVVLGLAARVAPDDAELIAVCRSGTRQQATRALDHARFVTRSDHLPGVVAALDAIDDQLADPPSRAETPAGGVRRLVVLLDDVAHTRRRLELEPDGGEVVDRFDRLLVAAAQSGDIDLVAIVHDIGDAGPIAALVPGHGLRTLTALTEADDGLSSPPKGRVTVRPSGEVAQLVDGMPTLEADVEARTGDAGDGL